jgi:hypothetical protein
MAVLHCHQFNVISAARNLWMKEGAPAAAKIAKDIYQCLSFREPLVYVMPSPLTARLAIPHLLEIHGRQSVFQDILDPITRPTGVIGNIQELTRIGAQMAAALSLPVKDQLNPELVDYFTDFMGRTLRDLGGEELLSSRMEAGFFGDLKPDDWWGRMSSSQVWWWPFTEFMVFAERPSEVHFESTRGLSRDDGPAATFKDGYRIYAVSGISVPERVIMRPETITVDEIMATESAEFRRVLILKMGPGEYLKKSGATLVDMDSLTLTGSAPRALMQDMFGEKWLVGTDGSTARVYTMSVAKDAQTCREAHDSISGFPETRIIEEA